MTRGRIFVNVRAVVIIRFPEWLFVFFETNERKLIYRVIQNIVIISILRVCVISANTCLLPRVYTKIPSKKAFSVYPEFFNYLENVSKFSFHKNLIWIIMNIKKKKLSPIDLSVFMLCAYQWTTFNLYIVKSKFAQPGSIFSSP